LEQLDGFSRTCITCNNEKLFLTDDFEDFGFVIEDGQSRGTIWWCLKHFYFYNRMDEKWIVYELIVIDKSFEKWN
jgi:hypothetical protein